MQRGTAATGDTVGRRRKGRRAQEMGGHVGAPGNESSKQILGGEKWAGTDVQLLSAGGLEERGGSQTIGCRQYCSLLLGTRADACCALGAKAGLVACRSGILLPGILGGSHSSGHILRCRRRHLGALSDSRCGCRHQRGVARQNGSVARGGGALARLQASKAQLRGLADDPVVGQGLRGCQGRWGGVEGQWVQGAGRGSGPLRHPLPSALEQAHLDRLSALPHTHLQVALAAALKPLEHGCHVVAVDFVLGPRGVEQLCMRFGCIGSGLASPPCSAGLAAHPQLCPRARAARRRARGDALQVRPARGGRPGTRAAHRRWQRRRPPGWRRCCLRPRAPESWRAAGPAGGAETSTPASAHRRRTGGSRPQMLMAARAHLRLLAASMSCPVLPLPSVPPAARHQLRSPASLA